VGTESSLSLSAQAIALFWRDSSTLDAVYMYGHAVTMLYYVYVHVVPMLYYIHVYEVPWSEFPIVSSYPHYPQAVWC